MGVRLWSLVVVVSLLPVVQDCMVLHVLGVVRHPEGIKEGERFAMVVGGVIVVVL